MAVVPSRKKFVQAARDNGYAVGGFNTNDASGLKLSCVRQKLRKHRCLSQASMGAAKYMGGYKSCCRNLIANLVESIGIMYQLQFTWTMVTTKMYFECIEVGYTSIMFDGSHLSSRRKP